MLAVPEILEVIRKDRSTPEAKLYQSHLKEPRADKQQREALADHPSRWPGSQTPSGDTPSPCTREASTSPPSLSTPPHLPTRSQVFLLQHHRDQDVEHASRARQKEGKVWKAGTPTQKHRPSWGPCLSQQALGKREQPTGAHQKQLTVTGPS